MGSLRIYLSSHIVTLDRQNCNIFAERPDSVHTLTFMAKRDENLDEKLAVRLNAELLRGLDRLRMLEPGLPGRARMVRLLIARALEAAEAKAKKEN